MTLMLLLEHNRGKDNFSIPENFEDLHGKIFKAFVAQRHTKVT